MLKRAYSQAEAFFHSYPIWDNRYIYMYGTESKLPAYLQIPSILSISFDSVLAVEVVLWWNFLFVCFSVDFFFLA